VRAQKNVTDRYRQQEVRSSGGQEFRQEARSFGGGQQEFRQESRSFGGGQQEFRQSFQNDYQRQSNSRQEAADSYQFRGAARDQQEYRVKSANTGVSPARYVVEQRVAYRPEQHGQYTRNTYQSSYSRENYGPGERRYSPLRKDGQSKVVQEETKDNKKEDEMKKVQFAEKKEEKKSENKK
jgi:hypothetical protein